MTDTKDNSEMDLVVFLPLLIILGAFMFFASRRQKKAMQATIDLHESLTVGDRVHTTSGLQATITDVSDDTVDLEIAPGVVTTWMKLAVRDRIEVDDEYDEAEEADEAEYIEEDVTTGTEAPGDPNQVKKD
jgi:preprotein translocase subunit YajC